MKYRKTFAYVMILTALVTKSCCVFKQGSWDPLPCGKSSKVVNTEEKENDQSKENIEGEQKDEKSNN